MAFLCTCLLILTMGSVDAAAKNKEFHVSVALKKRRKNKPRLEDERQKSIKAHSYNKRKKQKTI